MLRGTSSGRPSVSLGSVALSPVSKHTPVGAKCESQTSPGKRQLCSRGWGSPAPVLCASAPSGFNNAVGRNSKAWQGLNIASQATCTNAPLNLLKSRGWLVPLGTALCFGITAARLSLMGPRSFL